MVLPREVINKNVFPHAYEYHRLVGIHSEEGARYVRKHGKDIDREYGMVVETKLERKRLGGTKEIHIFEKINHFNDGKEKE